MKQKWGLQRIQPTFTRNKYEAKQKIKGYFTSISADKIITQ
jgi:hypothetical protein